MDVHIQRPGEMNDANVLSMASSNITAGSDTTAISTRAVIYHLLENPTRKRKLVKEIDMQMKAVGSATLITLEQTKRMPYLQACLYEGLRLHPASWDETSTCHPSRRNRD